MVNEHPICLRTTHHDTKLTERLDWFLQQPGCQWTLTQNSEGTIPELSITRNGVYLTIGRERLSFHPSMAIIRMLNLLRGGQDRFLEATELAPGDSVIDATFGLGTDALIGAWAVGDTGKVLALEKSPVLAAMAKDGLNHFTDLIYPPKYQEKQDVWTALTQASQRIELHWGDHTAYFKQIPANSFDVVYFDPMFRQTRRQSNSMLPLHQWSDHSPLGDEAIFEACRIARKRVVLKERQYSSEFQRLGFKLLQENQYSPVDYGVILV